MQEPTSEEYVENDFQSLLSNEPQKQDTEDSPTSESTVQEDVDNTVPQEDGGEESVTPDTQPEQKQDDSYKEIMNGWQLDRQELEQVEQENLRLQRELAQLRSQTTQEDEEELARLSPQEREQRIIQKHEESRQMEEDSLRKNFDRQYRFFRADPEFRRDEKQIFQFGKAIGSNDLAQTVKAFRAAQQFGQSTAAAKQYKENHKAKAETKSAKPGSGGAPKKIQGYDSSRDGEKSISELFTESL